jgi:hypothetical protein
MIRILGVSRFPTRVFLSCIALAIVAALSPTVAHPADRRRRD